MLLRRLSQAFASFDQASENLYYSDVNFQYMEVHILQSLPTEVL